MHTPYTIEEHQHRFASWAAGRAASVKGCRFKVHQAKAILEAVGFDASFSNPADLPNPRESDRTHREWRDGLIRAAGQQGLHVTHGVAAKLINCYVKVRFVCAGNHDHARVKAMHPPIDEVLLTRLAELNVGGFESDWKAARAIRWSKFDSDQYETVINLIRRSLPDQPLWKIEEYWAGHRKA
jgi:hypothetical protein